MDNKESKKPECPIIFNEELIGKDFVSFEVLGEPFAKQRPRATKKGRFITVYTPRETKLYEAKVLKAYRRIYSHKQLDGDLTVNVDGKFSVPKSISKSKSEKMLSGEIPHTKKPDCDNMAKVCLDALNGEAYPDDSIINRLNVSKEYSDTAMVRITIIKNNSKPEGEIYNEH